MPDGQLSSIASRQFSDSAQKVFNLASKSAAVSWLLILSIPLASTDREFCDKRKTRSMTAQVQVFNNRRKTSPPLACQDKKGQHEFEINPTHDWRVGPQYCTSSCGWSPAVDEALVNAKTFSVEQRKNLPTPGEWPHTLTRTQTECHPFRPTIKSDATTGSTT